MSKRHLLALFSNFDEAEAVVRELRGTRINGFNADKDMIVKSPIEHPEVEEFLGDKPVRVQWFTLAGALSGGSLAFLLISASQGNFFAQMKGGKPIVPFPPNFVPDLRNVHFGRCVYLGAWFPDLRRLACQAFAVI